MFTSPYFCIVPKPLNLALEVAKEPEFSGEPGLQKVTAYLDKLFNLAESRSVQIKEDETPKPEEFLGVLQNKSILEYFTKEKKKQEFYLSLSQSNYDPSVLDEMPQDYFDLEEERWNLLSFVSSIYPSGLGSREEKETFNKKKVPFLKVFLDKASSEQRRSLFSKLFSPGHSSSALAKNIREPLNIVEKEFDSVHFFGVDPAVLDLFLSYPEAEPLSFRRIFYQSAVHFVRSGSSHSVNLARKFIESMDKDFPGISDKKFGDEVYPGGVPESLKEKNGFEYILAKQNLSMRQLAIALALKVEPSSTEPLKSNPEFLGFLGDDAS